MGTPNDAFEQWRAASGGLLQVKDAAGRSILYGEGRDAMGEDHTICHVCTVVDGHEGDCAVGIAERVLRCVQGS